MADPYDLRSNMKDKPGSQGTLFQVKDKGLLNPQQRWPQGYTPDRLNEVRKGLERVPVDGPSHFYDQPSDETQKMYGFNEHGARERVTREIAKTTIPGDHLKGLTGIHGNPGEGTHGTYWKGPGRREIGYDMTGETGEDPHDQRKTLTHEIGHHVNMTLAPTPHVHTMVAQLHATNEAEGTDRKVTQTDIAMKRPKVAPNVDEAQADDYAVEHFRTGGRKSKGTETGAYEDNFSAHERDQKYPGYNDVRPPPLQGPQFQANSVQGMLPLRSPQPESALQRRLAASRDATEQATQQHVVASGPPQRRLIR